MTRGANKVNPLEETFIWLIGMEIFELYPQMTYREAMAVMAYIYHRMREESDYERDN